MNYAKMKKAELIDFIEQLRTEVEMLELALDDAGAPKVDPTEYQRIPDYNRIDNKC